MPMITETEIRAFSQFLRREERSSGTAQKYCRQVQCFAAWLGKNPVTKEAVSAWKEHLLSLGKAASTVNGALAALHSFFLFQGWTECRVKYLKCQRPLFRDTSRELTREEYLRLVNAADTRLSLLLQTICATGIRVSEVPYITVEAARRGYADIRLKGKLRTILIPGNLCRKLLKYAKKEKILQGEIFLTRQKKRLSRTLIWAQMKRLCALAGVAPEKVFPHNLRHLFARAFYKATRDIVKLADILGHSSVETTRIYLISTGSEHERQLRKLGFVT